MSLARDITTVGSGTLMSRLLGFFRDVGIAAVLGAGVLSDAFFAALQLSNLFRRLLAEGALNSAFVPMWLRIREERRAGQAKPIDSPRRARNDVPGARRNRSASASCSRPTSLQLLAPGFRVAAEREP